jgi:hypothetical protein
MLMLPVTPKQACPVSVPIGKLADDEVAARHHLVTAT